MSAYAQLRAPLFFCSSVFLLLHPKKSTRAGAVKFMSGIVLMVFIVAAAAVALAGAIAAVFVAVLALAAFASAFALALAVIAIFVAIVASVSVTAAFAVFSISAIFTHAILLYGL